MAKAELGQVIQFPEGGRPKYKQFCVDTPNGPKFRVPRLGKYIKDQLPVAVAGDDLHVYIDGVYRRDGERLLREVMVNILGDDWTQARSNETIAWLQAKAPKLLEDPPVDVINVRNGLLHISKGGEVKLKPHDPDFRTPIQLPVEYDPSATCPTIDAFMKTVFPDPAVRRLVVEITGYSVVPDNRLQKAFMLRGDGGNGKSTYFKILTKLLGHENVSHRSLHDLDENRFAPASLQGKLANICADLEDRELQSSSKFKEITGNEAAMTAERKHQNAFEFRPFSRLLFSANEVPISRDGSLAYYDRWIIIGCDVRIRGTELEDEQIEEKLTTPEELSGFFNLALEGLIRLRKDRRFTIPPSVQSELLTFRKHTDTVASFAAVRSLRRREWVAKADLYKEYEKFCKKSSLHSVSAQRFHVRYPLVVNVLERRRSGRDGWRAPE
jgi:putative DNA primase/helicase